MTTKSHKNMQSDDKDTQIKMAHKKMHNYKKTFKELRNDPTQGHTKQYTTEKQMAKRQKSRRKKPRKLLQRDVE